MTSVFCMRTQTEASFMYLSRYRPLLQPLIIIQWLYVCEREIEQQMKTQSRLSYLLSQLIPTPGCLLLSCQRWEWQVENGIPPSAVTLLDFFFFTLFFFLSTAFPDRLRIILLHAFMEVTEVRANTGKKVAEGVR